jgi:hypothetical protein
MQSRFISLFLKPSLFSGTITIIATLFIIGLANWPFFTYNSALYPILYGEFGAITALEQSPSLTQGIADSISNNSTLYIVVLGIAAIVVGWIVFLLARILRNNGQSIEALDRGDRSPIQRAVVRIGVLVMWLLYGYVTFSSIVPFILLISRIGAENILTVNGALMNVGAFFALFLIVHFHVIFARFFLLRPRVFGGNRDIEATAFSHDHLIH